MQISQNGTFASGTTSRINHEKDSLSRSKLERDGLNLIHMGDSITYGQNVDSDLRWTELTAKRIKTCHQNDLSCRVFNRGVSGITTRQGLERFPSDVQSLRPNLVTIQFGMNDCNCWESDAGLPRVSAAAFEANLAEMIHRTRQFGAMEIILATNHTTLRNRRMPSGETYEQANARYSDITRRVAAKEGVTLCDVREAFEQFSQRELETLLQPAPDLLHLSEEGNVVYANIIYPFIEQAIQRCIRELSIKREVIFTRISRAA